VLGTASQPQRTNPPARADALGGIVLPDHEPVALVWLRHYG
jgi:hypothetical protein